MAIANLTCTCNAHKVVVLVLEVTWYISGTCYAKRSR